MEAYWRMISLHQLIGVESVHEDTAYISANANGHLLRCPQKCVDMYQHIHLDQKHLKWRCRFTDTLIC